MILNSRDVYRIALDLVKRDKRKRYVFNSKDQTMHISYAQWTDKLSIFYKRVYDDGFLLVFDVEMGKIKHFDREDDWQIKLQKEGSGKVTK